jgi:hypothetical protein
VSAATDLRRVQELFWRLITAPEGVRPAVEEMARGGPAAATPVDDLFVGDGALPAVERLDVYANMYFFRLLDCLGEDYPKTRAAIGGDRFHNLVTDYLLLHPSGNPSLRHLGRHLPGFIAAHSLATDRPWLADLARLEWARTEIFDAPDAAPLTREDLGRLPQDAAGEARFTFVPAFDLLRLEYDAARIWRALDGLAEGEEATAAAGAAPRKPTAVRVWRNDCVVYHKSLADEEARCLDLARQGEPLARLCQRLAAGQSLARATQRVGGMIQGWIDDGILAGCTTGG